MKKIVQRNIFYSQYKFIKYLCANMMMPGRSGSLTVRTSEF